jgi:hypothetical protein
MSRTLAEQHNLISETKFRLKSGLLIALRILQNTIKPLPKFRDKQLLNEHPVISFSESDLWNNDDNEQNWILTAGKIENLRIAIRRINGLEINANQIFSFWKHIGNPNMGKGYVVGREIREGCIVPTVAGGLCQLSNALYDAALKAGFHIMERHKHTRVIKGSLAEQNRDATVKWNYVDLQFKADNAFRIEIDITADKLIVLFRSTVKANTAPQQTTNSRYSELNDCYSCGNFTCFKHPGKTATKQQKAITTFILDDNWDAYTDYISSVATDQDVFIIPKVNALSQNRMSGYNIKTLPLAALKRSLLFRLNGKLKNNAFATKLKLDKNLAQSVLKHIPVKSTHVVISQNLLPFIGELGLLGGRTYDVLSNSLPIEKLHERLNLAHTKHPESPTLNDYRAPDNLIALENSALTRSRHIITHHQEIADLFNNKSIKLEWIYPSTNTNPSPKGNKILFPASALGRKGAYEVKQLAQELDLTIVITGKATEKPGFWESVKVEAAGSDIFNDIALVVYPAYIESYPKLLLKAISAGIPVITTTASGLSPAKGLTILSVGDYEALKKAVTYHLRQTIDSDKLALVSLI